ncbi:hypothetical protein JCM14469_28450 [Desulfatiferula olefinivorans]
MALSVVTLYRDILPRTNCGDCGFPTCTAFAGMVVSQKYPLKNCPHIGADVLARCEAELAEQYAQGKWLKRDLAEDALTWARSRAASMALDDLPDRIGGRLVDGLRGKVLELPYFNGLIHVAADTVTHADGRPLTRWEQVFVFNHLAQGGIRKPRGQWKGFVEFPNTVSKVVTMTGQVEEPLIRRFSGRKDALRDKAAALGAVPFDAGEATADLALCFTPLPRVPVALLFWDGVPEEGFEAQVRLMFDVTVTEHLDIESIVFLSERIRQLLCDDEPKS